jgi:hypothetical protein
MSLAPSSLRPYVYLCNYVSFSGDAPVLSYKRGIPLRGVTPACGSSIQGINQYRVRSQSSLDGQ